MASNSGPRKAAKESSPSQEPRPEVTVEDGVEPLFALHKITYGAGKVALQEIFTPVSEDERNEILKLKAGRPLTEAEQALFEKINSAKSAATAASTESTDTAAETPPSDSDVIA